MSSVTVKCAHKEHDLTSDWQRRLQWTGLHADGKDEIVALENDLNKRHDKAGKAFEDDVLALIDRYGTIPADDLARLIEQHLHGVLDGYEDRCRNGFEELSRAATDHAWERMGRDPVNMRTAALVRVAVEDNRGRYRDNFANSFSRIKTLPQNVIDNFQSKMMESMYTDRTKEQVMRSVIGDIIDDLGDDRAAIREVWNRTKKDLQRVLRTETVNAYSRAQLEQWLEEGIREVTRHCIYDKKTCPLCRELARPGNNIYEIAKLLTVEHPVTEDPDNPGEFYSHPNCRCWFQPVFESRTPSGSASWDEINEEDDRLFVDIENPKALVQDVPLGSQEAIGRILDQIQTPDLYQFVPDITALPEWQASRLEELRKTNPVNAEKILADEVSGKVGSTVLQWTDPDVDKTYISDKTSFSQWVTFPIARKDGENAWFELSRKDRDWWDSRYRKKMRDTQKTIERHGIEIFGGIPFFSQAIEDGETYFSEAYAFYLVDPVTLQMMDPEAYGKMRARMFSGKEFIEAGGVN